MIVAARPRLPSRLPVRMPGLVTVGAAALFVLLVLGLGPWVLLAAVVVPLVVAILTRPQRGILLLVALLPFFGLLVLTRAPDFVWAWKEVLVAVVLGLTLVARPENRGDVDRSRPRWFPALLAFMVLAGVSALTVPGFQVIFGLKAYFFWTLAALAIWRCPLDESERDTLVTILMVMAFVTAVYGIVQQIVGSWTLVSWGYKWGMQVRTTGPYLRSFSTFAQPFPFAYFLMLVIIVGVATSVGEPRRLRSRLFFAALPVLVAGLVFSFVRGAWLGTAIGLLYLAFRRHRVLVFGIPIAVVALLFAPGGSFSQSAFTSETLEQRTSSWQRNMNVLLDNPFGTGTGSTGAARERSDYAEAGIKKANLQWSEWPPTRYQPDNWYVKVAFELGVVGVWLWLALMISILAWLRRVEARTEGRDRDLVVAFGGFVLATMVVSVISTFFEISPLDAYFWVLLGVVATIAPRRPRAPGAADPSGP